MPTLQKRFVDSAEPGRHYDDRLPGFGLYVGANGAKSYFVEYRPGRGRRVAKRRFSFAKHGGPRSDGGSWTPDTARDYAMRLLGRIKDGHDPLAERESAERLKANIVAGAVDLWLAKDQSGNRSYAEVKRLFENDVLPAWGKRPLSEIRKRDVIELIDKVHNRAPFRANRLLAHLRRFFNWCCGRDILQANPTAHVEKPAAEVKRRRVLSAEELVLIWNATAGGGEYDTIVRLLMLLGQRREEVAGMRRTELALRDTLWSLPPERTKNKLSHDVPLPEATLALIKAVPTRMERDSSGEERPRDLLFGEGKGPFAGWSKSKAALDARILSTRLRAADIDPDRATPEQIKAYRLPSWRLHDLRRTVVTCMNDELEVPPHIVEAIVNHVTGDAKKGAAGVYNHAKYNPQKRRALDRWAQYIAELVAGAERKVVSMRA